MVAILNDVMHLATARKLLGELPAEDEPRIDVALRMAVARVEGLVGYPVVDRPERLRIDLPSGVLRSALVPSSVTAMRYVAAGGVESASFAVETWDPAWVESRGPLHRLDPRALGFDGWPAIEAGSHVDLEAVVGASPALLQRLLPAIVVALRIEFFGDEVLSSERVLAEKVRPLMVGS